MMMIHGDGMAIQLRDENSMHSVFVVGFLWEGGMVRGKKRSPTSMVMY